MGAGIRRNVARVARRLSLLARYADAMDLWDEPPCLVDCYFLRKEGAKLGPHSVKANGATRGFLIVHRRLNPSVYPGDKQRKPWLVTAEIQPTPGRNARALLWLEQARAAKRSANGVLIYGLETIGGLGTGRRLPQAWWCVYSRDDDEALLAPVIPAGTLAA